MTIAATGMIPPDQPGEYVLDADALEGARVGVWRFETGSPETDAITDQAVAALVAAGAQPVDVDLPHLDVVGENEFPALLAEFKRDINAYLAETPVRHPADLAGLIAFNLADPFELEFFGQELFELALAAPSTDDPTYLAQRAAATDAARRAIDETLATPRPRRDHGAHQQSRLGDDTRPGRRVSVRVVEPRRGEWLSERDRARRLRRPAPRGDVVLRHGVGRRRRLEPRLRLRASHAGPSPAELLPTIGP